MIIEEFEAWLGSVLGLSTDTVARLLTAMVVLLAVYIVRLALMRFLDSRINDVQVRHRWRRSISVSMLLLGLLFASSIIFTELLSLATVLGLLGAGLALILQDPIANVVAWFYIIARQEFEIGDRIEIAGMRGDVIDIRFFNFILLEVGEWVDADQSTGRVLHIPNRLIFNEALSNYHSGIGSVWNEIRLTITFDSNYRRAIQTLERILEDQLASTLAGAQQHAQEAQHRFPIVYSTLEPAVFMKVVDNGIRLSMRFVCDPRQRRSTEHMLWQSILDAFSTHRDIRLAYPTTRLVQSGPAVSTLA
ncbi:MAG: mechanosensitive ion channel domain-containing protein [Anaerolineae bacterium]